MPRIRFSLGVAPEHASQMNDDVEDQIRQLASDKRVNAIGSCGLSVPDDASQVETFARHIRLAKECEKPLIVDAEGAYDEALSILLREGLPEAGVLVRAFAGTEEQLRVWVDAGCYVSFDNRVTFEPERFCRLARLVPGDRILIESGAVPANGNAGETSARGAGEAHVVAPLAEYPPRPDQVVFVADALLGVCKPGQLTMNHADLFH